MDVDSQTPSPGSRATAEFLIDACLQEGVDHFFIAPGSRCTPLTMAVADRPQARVVQHFDERGLAYACVGYARATGRPGAFICTSGTAVVNASPAVVEASLDHVPLLLLTADRPPELRDTGANQTIDQVKVFADFTRWFFDLPCPGPPLTDRFWRSAVAHAVDRAAEGPVQLNCMFREPFDTRDLAASEHSQRPIPPSIRLNTQIAWQVPEGRTLVIAGGCRPAEALAARRLAERIGCPFLADITSGLRRLSHDLLLMRDDAPAADVIIHVGGRIVSKRWLQFVAAHPPQHFLHLTPFFDRHDPLHRVTQVIRGELVSLCDGARCDAPSPAEFLEAWLRRSRLSERAAEDVIDGLSTVNEPGIVRLLAGELPAGNGLLLGNSLPIRTWDTFGRPGHDRSAPGNVAANRGASGIDGLIATATGFAIGLRQTRHRPGRRPVRAARSEQLGLIGGQSRSGRPGGNQQ